MDEHEYRCRRARNHAEAALLKSEERFRAMANNALVVI
jgi:hypothetical protein